MCTIDIVSMGNLMQCQKGGNVPLLLSIFLSAGLVVNDL
jgi:hypothetical protein